MLTLRILPFRGFACRLLRCLLVIHAAAAVMAGAACRAQVQQVPDDDLPGGASVQLGDDLFRHEGWHKHVAFSSDGRILVSSSERSIKFWHARTGRLIRKLPADDIHRLMRMTPDRKHIATLGNRWPTQDKPSSGVIRLWNIETGIATSEIVVFHDEPGGMTELAFSSDGTRAFLGDSTGWIRVIDLETRAEVFKQRVGGQQEILAIAISPDGKFAAVAVNHNRLLFWDWQAQAEPVQIGKGRRYLGVAFSPDGKLLAAGADSRKTVEVFDAAKGTLLRELQDDPVGPIYAEQLVFTPDGKMLAVANAVSLIGKSVAAALLWDVESGKLVRRFTAQGMRPRSLSISPDGRRLAAIDWDSGPRIWNLDTGQTEVGEPGGHSGMIRTVKFSPSSQQLLTAGGDQTARVWDAVTGREIARLDHDKSVHAAAFSPGGKLVCTACVDDTIAVWDVSAAKKVHSTKGERDLGGAWQIAFSADGNEVVAVEDDLRICAWSAADGAILRELQVKPSELKIEAEVVGGRKPLKEGAVHREDVMKNITTHALSSDGLIALLAGRQEYWIFDTKSGQELSHRDLTFQPQTFAISADGFRIAIGGRGRSGQLVDHPGVFGTESISPLSIINRKTSEEVWKTELPTTRCGPIAFSPDGELLAVGLDSEQDGVIQLFDAGIGKLLHTIEGIEPAGWADEGLAFSPDGTKMASTQREGTVLVWDVAKLPLDQDR